jgi:hypothetical protein
MPRKTVHLCPQTRKQPQALPAAVFLVHEILVTWNPIYDSILTIYKKLVNLGLRLVDGEIVVDTEGERHV